MGLFGKPEPRPVAEPVRAPQPVPTVAAAAAPSKSASRTTILGEKTRYVGRIDTDEPILILGHLEGEIKSTSEVEVGNTGDVKAALFGRTIVISGRVTGDCSATDRLEIQASGRLEGGVKAARIVIAEGAQFKGTSQMAGAKA